MALVLLHSAIINILLLASLSECLTEEDYARDYLSYLNKKMADLNNKYYLAEWNYSTNLTDDNLKKFLAASEKLSRESKEDHYQLMKFDWKHYKSKTLKRQFKLFSILEELALPNEKYQRLTQIISHMQEVYAKAKFCSFQDATKCDLQLEPHFTEIMASSRDPEELQYVWLNWRKSVGSNLRKEYMEYVNLMNEAARLNGFKDATEMVLNVYETPDIKDQIRSLWQQIRPAYLQLHAYVRRKLRNFYGNIVSEKGPMPAHLLGNMWSQSWEFIANLTMPYPDKKAINITKQLIQDKFTPLSIFRTAEDFFVSINLTAMPKCFWDNSILTKPKDRDIVCHATAWDFADGKDYRIRQCTRVEQESFVTAHHEMGHVEYYLQYRNLPPIFQGGASPAFHEAVGDTVALSVTTLKHYRKLGLRKVYPDDPCDVINHLFMNALTKIPFMPFGYLVDLWRWEVFSGVTKPDNYNCRWWQLSNDYQGIEPPCDRTEKHFDAASKYHVVANYEYIAYFMSYILQYQFQKALCRKADLYEPGKPSKALHECDIYGSIEAGNLFKKMLSLGSSQPWPEALYVLTGSRTMDAGPLLEYFDPLIKWLENENKRAGNFVGWTRSHKICKR